MALDDQLQPKNRGLLWRALFTPRRRTSGRGTIIWLLCMAAHRRGVRMEGDALGPERPNVGKHRLRRLVKPSIVG
jgi:hypothetical protein